MECNAGPYATISVTPEAKKQRLGGRNPGFKTGMFGGNSNWRGPIWFP